MGNPLDVVQPILAWRFIAEQIGQGGCGVGHRAAANADQATWPGHQFDVRSLGDRCRQDETTVIIRVFADQVDSAGSIGSHHGAVFRDAFVVPHTFTLCKNGPENDPSLPCLNSCGSDELLFMFFPGGLSPRGSCVVKRGDERRRLFVPRGLSWEFTTVTTTEAKGPVLWTAARSANG